MKLYNSLLLTALCLGFACSEAEPQRVQPTDLVNPFLGTETMWDEAELGYTPTRRTWGAEVFPGSSLPNAMVQLSPVTEFRAGGGYQYEDTVIYGFSHTNKGHWNLNYVPILPVNTRDITVDDYQSSFSHSNESARPAYYQVFLERYGVNVELTSTLRCAYHKYEFNRDDKKFILVNMPNSNEGVRSYSINLEGKNSFSGMQQSGETIYFYAECNYDIVALDSIVERTSKQLYSSDNAPGANGEPMAKHDIPLLTLADNGSEEAVELKIGFSFVGVEAAKKNLEAEMAGKSFEDVKTMGNDTWNELLSKIEIEGGTDKQQGLFYSTLYRSMLWPALRSDVDGSFTDDSGKVVNKGFDYYTDPSFWDDYRNKLVLLTMLRPEVTSAVISSCIDRGEHSGFMPTFFHGDHASVYVAGSYLRGVRDFDVNKAYELMVRNATVEGPARPFLQEYIDNGYISEVDLSSLPKIEIHTDAKSAVTKTQEYSYDDYAVALLARELGEEATYQTMMKRSENYKNLFDSSDGFFKGKLSNGEWVKNFDPCHPYFYYQFREATGWQSAFFAPHDTPALIEMYGGKDAFETKLDSLFSIEWQGHEAHNISTFIGQYCHGNQPNHTFPFLYSFIGKPEKSQRIIDTLLNEYYTMGANDLSYCGMDDAGEMSSWFVLTSLGIYTYSPADAEYLVTVPLFDKARFEMQGSRFTITKEGDSRELESISYDGRELEGLFISHDELLRGKELLIKAKY